MVRLVTKFHQVTWFDSTENKNSIREGVEKIVKYKAGLSRKKKDLFHIPGEVF
jgi:hypothetical protein